MTSFSPTPFRLYKTTSLTSAINTAGEQFQFQQVPMGSVWTGTVQVIQAPVTAFHQATISGILWAEWTGYIPSPVLQAVPGETIIVTSFGLNAGTTYQCSLIGSIDDDATYIPVWPLSGTTDITAYTPIDPVTIPIQGAGVPFSQQITVPIPGPTLGIQFQKVTGTADGFLISVSSPPPIGVPPGNWGTIWRTTYPRPPAQTQAPFWYVPVAGILNPIITITPILNKSIGGTYSGVLTVVYTGMDISIPVLTPWGTPLNIALGQGPSVGYGLNAGNVVAAGQTTMTNSPFTGLCYLLRNLTITNAVQPAANGALEIRGAQSNQIYWRTMASIIPAGAPSFMALTNPIYIFSGTTDDPAEAIAINNGTSIGYNISMSIDVVPCPQVADF